MRELLVLTMVLLTAACSATEKPSPRPVPETPVAALPLPAPRPENPKVQPAAPMPVPRPSAPSTEPINLDQFAGTTEASVLARIGHPDAIREQSPGKVWVYSQSGCQVEVYMFPRVGYGSMGGLGTAILPASLSADDRDRCRRSLARRSAKAG